MTTFYTCPYRHCRWCGERLKGSHLGKKFCGGRCLHAYHSQGRGAAHLTANHVTAPSAEEDPTREDRITVYTWLAEAGLSLFGGR